MKKAIGELLKKKSGINLDIGGGENTEPGYVNLDYRDLEGVDIVHDVMQFPWPLPDECVSRAVARHLLEHIVPDNGDKRVHNLVELLLKKKIITKKEVNEAIGEVDHGPRFIRFMDEVWRILKPGAQFATIVPYAGSPGYWQDPTHVNPINEVTWAYFDPLHHRIGGQLYGIYRPKPWKVEFCAHTKEGFMETILQKRQIDKSYGTL